MLTKTWETSVVLCQKGYEKSCDTEIILLDQLQEHEPLLLLVQQVTGFNECNKNNLNIESVEKN